METKQKPLLLTVREVAKLLRIHRPKVYLLIRDGSIDGFKLGADWRIRRQSIEDLIGPIPDTFFTSGGRDDDEDDEIEDENESSRRISAE